MVFNFIKHIKSKVLLRFIERMLNYVYRPLFYIISRWERRKWQQKKYYLAVCAIFKDEGKYLEEWIEWQRIIGVEHIYLYNNNSTDDYLTILQPYIAEEYVTLIEWPLVHGQMQAYQDCFEHFAHEMNWLALFDLDEFLCPLREVDVKQCLKRYEGYPGLRLHWKMFGSNGFLNADPDKLVVERYVNSWSELDGTGKIILSTHESYKPTKSVYHHHMFFWYALLGMPIKVPVVREKSYFTFFPQLYDFPKEYEMQLNHYWSKSYGEYIAKIAKGDVASAEGEEIRRKQDFFYRHEHHNISCDYSAYRFLIKLKLSLALKRRTLSDGKSHSRGQG